MNKRVLIIGLLAFAVAFLFPPWTYVNVYAGAVSRLLGGGLPDRDTAFRFIGGDGYIYSAGGTMIGSDAQIHAGLWLAILGGIAFATFALAAIVGKRKPE